MHILLIPCAIQLAKPLIKDPSRKGHYVRPLYKGHRSRSQKLAIPYSLHALRTAKERTTSLYKRTKQLNFIKIIASEIEEHRYTSTDRKY